MPEALALFEILLSPERTPDERLEALQSLQPFLETDEAAAKLAAAARMEASVPVRSRMLELLCNIPITRLAERNAFIDTFAWMACLEPEAALRLMAVQQLAALAPHRDDVQTILAETLVYELDHTIQQACIYGLGNTVHKTPDTIQKIAGYIPLAPAACKAGLLQLAKQFPIENAPAAVLQFISPLETPSTRIDALQFLGNLPVLPAAAISALATQLLTEVDRNVRSAIVDVLTHLPQVDSALLNGVLTALQRMPDQPELLALLENRLVAYPALQEQLAQHFTQSNAAGLKIKLLSLLQHSDLPTLLVSALQDENPYVRNAAIPYLQQQFARFQEQLEPALAAAIRKEPLSTLQSDMATVLLQTGRKTATTNQLIVELALTATDQRLKVQLAEAATQLVVTDDNKKPLLQLFREIMEGVYFPVHLKTQVRERLRTFSYNDAPDLKRSLELMLDEAKTMEEVSSAYALLKTLEPDLHQLAPVMIRVLYRHIAWYPQSPLDEWVQQLGKMAAQDVTVRAALPYIVSLTKANWLLSETDKANQTGAFLPAFKQTLLKKNGMQTFLEAERMLDEAWQNRTIKKAEVISLYRMLLSLPKTDGILQKLLQIMQTGKLVTPELVQLSLDYVLTAIDRDGTYMVRKYLESTGFMDLGYREKVWALFKPENFRRYQQLNAPGLHSKRRYATLNDWEYGGWYGAYNQWPVAELVFTMEPGTFLAELFANPPAGTDAPEATLQYLVLEHLFRTPQSAWGKSLFGNIATLENFLRLLYHNIRLLPENNGLRDRMVYFSWKKWNDYLRLLSNNPVPADLAMSAAIVYIAVCKVLQRLEPTFDGKKFPDVLKGMSKETVQAQWPWNQELWETFEYRHFPKADPDQDAAQQRYQQAAKALQAGDMQGGYAALKDLLAYYPHTRLVKEQLHNINSALERIEVQLK